MRADERRLGVPPEDPVERGQDLVERRETGFRVGRRAARRPEVPVGMVGQLLPAPARADKPASSAGPNAALGRLPDPPKPAHCGQRRTEKISSVQ